MATGLSWCKFVSTKESSKNTALIFNAITLAKKKGSKDYLRITYGHNIAQKVLKGLEGGKNGIEKN